jgi:hypothetical protein
MILASASFMRPADRVDDKGIRHGFGLPWRIEPICQRVAVEPESSEQGKASVERKWKRLPFFVEVEVLHREFVRPQIGSEQLRSSASGEEK